MSVKYIVHTQYMAASAKVKTVSIEDGTATTTYVK